MLKKLQECWITADYIRLQYITEYVSQTRVAILLMFDVLIVLDALDNFQSS